MKSKYLSKERHFSTSVDADISFVLTKDTNGTKLVVNRSSSKRAEFVRQAWTNARETAPARADISKKLASGQYVVWE